MDAEISGPTNYTALNLLSDMRKGYGKRLILQQPCLFIVEIYNGLYCKDGISNERRNQINSFS
jgi:hypothetical protein